MLFSLSTVKRVRNVEDSKYTVFKGMSGKNETFSMRMDDFCLSRSLFCSLNNQGQPRLVKLCNLIRMMQNDARCHPPFLLRKGIFSYFLSIIFLLVLNITHWNIKLEFHLLFKNIIASTVLLFTKASLLAIFIRRKKKSIYLSNSIKEKRKYILKVFNYLYVAIYAYRPHESVLHSSLFWCATIWSKYRNWSQNKMKLNLNGF